VRRLGGERSCLYEYGLLRQLHLARRYREQFVSSRFDPHRLLTTRKDYDTAYWELNYVKTFTVNGSASANGSSTGTAGANATGGGSGTTTSPTGKSAATRTWSAERMAAAAAAAAAAAVLALALAA
jgi:hypothetical protein